MVLVSIRERAVHDPCIIKSGKRAFSTEVEPKFSITLAEWRAILMLSQRPRPTANEVTQRWSMKKMAVNRAIRKLEVAGAISRNKKTRQTEL